MEKGGGGESMATCQSCGKAWRWKQSFKKMFTLDTALECPHCGKKQYLTPKARKRSSVYTLLTPFILLLLFLFDVSPLISIGVLFVFLLLMMGTYPFIIELSNQEEDL